MSSKKLSHEQHWYRQEASRRAGIWNKALHFNTISPENWNLFKQLTMMDHTSSGITENSGTSDFPVVSELKAMFADLLEDAKKDILSNVQESIDQIYADFEYVESESEGPQNQVSPEANTVTAVATKINNFIEPEPSDLGEGSSSGSFKTLAEELSLRQETRNNDSAFQKAQSLLLSGLYAVLQTCNSSSGQQKNVPTHAAVLLLSSNRELSLKRRDLIRPD
ncbi:hypothetical protein P5673_015136 [Acropora cervicornis]|uniref:Uncharacterized protein n=1 Tax=Acropora cervicornis TaxID=6130 RepID=A0AAD9QIX8_ACRCE|nr:hypothetical protein P5673_015136 [Acropora cervicornis]